MKIRPLPDLDLARIAPLPIDQQRKALRGMRMGRPPYSYQPVRGSLSDLLGIEGSLIASPRVPWSKIADTICTAAKSDAEEEANLRVAHGLYEFALLHGLRGRKHEFLSLALGLGDKVIFWHSCILLMEGRPTVPFFDPRRAALSPLGRRFAFSAMHERIRVADPDFANVQFAIVQFKRTDEGPREPVPHFDRGIELFSLEELNAMSAQTQQLWLEVCFDREAEVRRRAGGSGTLL